MKLPVACLVSGALDLPPSATPKGIGLVLRPSSTGKY
jgi:hypothetical protein